MGVLDQLTILIKNNYNIKVDYSSNKYNKTYIKSENGRTETDSRELLKTEMI